jgi:hypothetical protein
MRIWYRVLPALLMASGASYAQDAETAAKLQLQLRSFFSGWAPGSGSPDGSPLRVTAEADRYRITLPLVGAAGEPANDIVATARPIAGGRWAIESSLPSPASATVTIATNNANGADEPTRYTVRLGGEQGAGELDPSFATPSSLSLELRDFNLVTDHAAIHQEQHFDRYSMQGRLVPTADGRVDFEAGGSSEAWKVATQESGGVAVDFGVQTMRGTSNVTGISRDSAGSLLAAFTALAPMLPSNPDEVSQLDAEQMAALRKGLRPVVAALRGSLTGMRSEGTLEGIQASVGGVGSASVRQVKVGLAAEAPNNLLHAWLDLAVDGVVVPTLPPEFVELLPNYVAIRPSVAGVDLATLTRLADEITADNPDPARVSREVNALWTSRTARLGIDSLSIALGATRLEGKGQVRFAGSGQPTASARLTASGFDALMATANSKPVLQQAIPFLLMARGMAKSEGNLLVWDIVANGDKIMVNGTDLKQMGQSSGPSRRSDPHKR